MTQYIVRRYFVSNAPGLYGWDCRSEMVPSCDDALQAIDAKMPKGCIKVVAMMSDGSSELTEIAYRERNARTGKTERRHVFTGRIHHGL